MEPLNCTVKLDGDRCEIWTGTQFQTMDQAGGEDHGPQARAGQDPHHVPRRRLRPARQSGRATSWPRPCTSRRRPGGAGQGRLDARGRHARRLLPADVACTGSSVGLDAGGLPVAWKHTIVGQSIMDGTPFAAMMVKDGVDETSVEGRRGLALREGHAEPSRRSALAEESDPGALVALGRPHAHGLRGGDVRRRAGARGETGSARVPAHAPQGAPAPPRGPQSGRGEGRLGQAAARGALSRARRPRIVRQLRGRGRGGLGREGQIRVHRVVCAIDCGICINPAGVAAQVESASSTASPPRSTARSP